MNVMEFAWFLFKRQHQSPSKLKFSYCLRTAWKICKQSKITDKSFDLEFRFKTPLKRKFKGNIVHSSSKTYLVASDARTVSMFISQL